MQKPILNLTGFKNLTITGLQPVYQIFFMKARSLTFLLLLLTFFLFAQTDDLSKINHLRLNKQRIGMLVLGTWAVGNIATGALLTGQRTGEDRYFHQMNIAWNAVNLGLATFGYFNAINADPAAYDLAATIQQQYNVEKILLLNTGLDVGYVLGGLYLMERSKDTAKNPARLKGFGRSIVLQGSFLFAFDLAFYLVHANTRSAQWQQLLSSVYFDGSRVGMVLQF